MDTYTPSPPPVYLDPATLEPVDTYGADPMMAEVMAPAPVQIGPNPPIWYTKPPKPKKDWVIEDAENNREDHRMRVKIAAEMLQRLNLEVVGSFERDREAIENGEIETFQSTALRDEHDAACAWVAGMSISYEAKYRETIDREEATAKEDFLHYIWEAWQEAHGRGGTGPLRWALPDVLQKYGMLAAYVSIDPTNDETGLRIKMVDPATVFPVHEGDRGLESVYRIYRSTASAVIGDFGDPAGSVERKVKKVARASRDGRWDRNFDGEVIEYWDRNWGMVLFEKEVIRIWEHGYACVPFIIKYGCFGMQGFTRTPDDTLPFNRPDADGFKNTERQTDLARMAQPFLFRRIRAHDLEEAVGGRYVTAFRKSVNPPKIVKQGMLSAVEGDPELDDREGAISRLRNDDEVEALPTSPAPEIIGPLQEFMGFNRQTGMAPGLLMGQNPAAQTSGTALDVLAQGGLEKWSPLVLVIEEFLTEVGRRSLELVRDWGAILGADGERGMLVVPRRNPNPRTGEAPAHEVTPELLRATGTRVVCRLKKFNPNSLPQLGAGLTQFASLGIMDKRTMIALSGFTDDPDSVLARVDEEMLEEVPEIKQAQTLDLLYAQAEKAMRRGDERSAYMSLMKARYVASEMELAQMRKMQMMGGMGVDMMGMGMEMQMAGVPGAVPPDLPPGVPPPQDAPPGVQGMSMPQLGIDTGTEGGRPPAAPMPVPMGGD